MFGLFKNPAREGRQLERDARSIISMERESSTMDRLNEIADELREELEKARERINFRESDRKVVMYDLKRTNAAARRFSQIRFSALTLTIIAVRADELGDSGNAALHIIESFMENPGVDNDTFNA